MLKDLSPPIWSIGQNIRYDVTTLSPFYSTLLSNASPESNFGAQNAKNKERFQEMKQFSKIRSARTTVSHNTSSGVSLSPFIFLNSLLLRFTDVSFLPWSRVLNQYFYWSSFMIQQINSNLNTTEFFSEHGNIKTSLLNCPTHQTCLQTHVTRSCWTWKNANRNIKIRDILSNNQQE